jgi:hypothetical protein
VVPLGHRHDYIDCVIQRWEKVEYEPGRLNGAKLKQDMKAVVHELRHADGR